MISSINNLPKPIFIGFFPKITTANPDWLSSSTIREICSVAECISPGPQGWIQQWKHTLFGFYDSEELAMQVIAQNINEYDLYAYRLFPLNCAHEKIEILTIESVGGTVPGDYAFHGYDIVTKSGSDFFECSPLSCNYLANDYEVNQYCLIDDLEAAYKALLDICQSGRAEPGPYYLFEVYRKRRSHDPN